MKDPRPIVGVFRSTTAPERLAGAVETLAKAGHRVGIFGFKYNPSKSDARIFAPGVGSELEGREWAESVGATLRHGFVTLSGEVYIRELRGGRIETRPRLFPEKPLRPDCFVAAAGGALVDEIEPFLCGIRAFHAEPVFLFCDEAGADEAARVVQKYKLEGVTVWHGFTPSYRANAENAARNVARHASRFSVSWILAKIDATRRAMEAMPPGAGVMLLDTDITLAAPISGEYQADLVLSPHFVCHPEKKGDQLAGYWNAGFMLLRGLEIVDRWRDFYLSGEGGFYEQKCLERLSVEYVTEIFPLAHNAGYWRDENFEESKRRPASLHCHLSEAPHGALHRAVHGIAKAAATNAIEAASMPHRKLAFVHLAKHGGSYVTERLERELEPRGFQILDPWHNPALGREWKPDEIDLILRGRLWGMRSNPRHFMRAHQWGWTREALETAKREGWLTFTFLRDPLDAICSAYFFHRGGLIEGGRGRIWQQGEGGRSAKALDGADTLDKGCKALIEDPDLVAYWSAPEWLEGVDFLRPFSSESLRELCDEIKIPFEPGEKINGSENPGFKAAIEGGLISSSLAKKMRNHPEVERINELIARAR